MHFKLSVITIASCVTMAHLARSALPQSSAHLGPAQTRASTTTPDTCILCDCPLTTLFQMPAASHRLAARFGPADLRIANGSNTREHNPGPVRNRYIMWPSSRHLVSDDLPPRTNSPRTSSDQLAAPSVPWSLCVLDSGLVYIFRTAFPFTFILSFHYIHNSSCGLVLRNVY